MSEMQRLLLIPIAKIFLGVLTILSFCLSRHSNSKRIITLTSAYAEITSARRKTMDEKEVRKDYDALANIGLSMGLVKQKSALELPLILQRFFSCVLRRNLFWDDKTIIQMIDTIDKERSQSSIDKFVQHLYDKTPMFLKYGSRDEMINDLRKIVNPTFGISPA